jgi:hypothetical protein
MSDKNKNGLSDKSKTLDYSEKLKRRDSDKDILGLVTTVSNFSPPPPNPNKGKGNK